MNDGLRQVLEMLRTDDPDPSPQDIETAYDLLHQLGTFDCASMQFVKTDRYELRWQPDQELVLGDLYWYTKDTGSAISGGVDETRQTLLRNEDLIVRVCECEMGIYPEALAREYRAGDCLGEVIGMVATFLGAYDNIGYFSAVRFGNTALTVVSRKGDWTVRGTMSPIVAPVVGATYTEALSLYLAECRKSPSQPDDEWIKLVAEHIRRLKHNYNRRAAKSAGKSQ